MESQVIGTFFQEGVLTSLPVDVIIIRVKFLMENKVHVNLWRHNGLMFSALTSRLRGPGSSPGQRHCVLRQDTLFWQCFSPTRCINEHQQT